MTSRSRPRRRLLGTGLVILVATLLLVVATGVATARAQATAETDNSYVVGPQDVLRIVVFQEASLSDSYTLDANGSFQYPLLGRLTVQGMTLREVEELIAGRLMDGFVRRPQVSVEIEEFRARSVFVIGQVRTPGEYPIEGRLSLIEALAAAGSTTQDAGTRILVLRSQDPLTADAPLDPEAIGDESNVLEINLADLQRGMLSQNIQLMEGDTVFVPEAQRFFVTGQVNSPGAYTFVPNTTVLQAISLAGGLNDRGSDRRMEVIRTVDGRPDTQGIGLEDIIQPGDTLIIKQRLF